MRYHVDGELVPAEEATINVRDRGFRYGDAAFETMRAYGGELFAWNEHVNRLFETLDVLEMDHGLQRADLRDRCRSVLMENDVQDGMVRLSVTRGTQPGTLTPAPSVDPTVVILVRKLPRGGVQGDAVWAAPARARTVRTRRIADNAIPARLKTHNYLNGILAELELRETGDDEAILLDGNGRLTEATTSNLFFVREDALHTPSLQGPVLPGVTRSVVLELAREEGIPIETGRYPPAALHAADEAFLTNSSWEVRPIARCDGVELGSGPVTELLSTVFDHRIEEDYY